MVPSTNDLYLGLCNRMGQIQSDVYLYNMVKNVIKWMGNNLDS